VAGGEFLNTVKQSLEAYRKLMAEGQKLPLKKKTGEDFLIEALNLDCDVNELRGKVERIDKALASAEGLEGGSATMLFYGPPGTGKTGLARHLAAHLDRECLVVRGSDLLSPYVGQTEKAIAEAFAKAEKDEAILVIDEADTFLFSRDMAQRSWESSMVNEFLTDMEDYRGILICTTNRKVEMDKAAMRRFTFKIKFGYLSGEGKVLLYKKLLAPLVSGKPMARENLNTLLAMSKLTPGDYSAVKKNVLHGPEISHKVMMKALAMEVQLKVKVGTTRIGF